MTDTRPVPADRTTGEGRYVPQPRELRHLMVKNHLIDTIDTLPPGYPIPPERDLAASCRTSRTTVRKAVSELVAEGRLTRRHGAGTFVAEPKITWPLMVSGFTEQAANDGLRVRTTLVSSELIPATPELADRLGLRRGGRVLALELLRSVNDTPMAVEKVHVSARRFPGLVPAVARSGSLYEVLREKFGVHVAHAVETIETAPAAPREATLLETETGAPMLLVSQHSHTAEGEPVEWVRSWYRGDRYAFIAHISRGPAADGALMAGAGSLRQFAG